MKIMAIEQENPNNTLEQFQPHLQAEARRVWELQQAGIIREIYFERDKYIAVIVLECADTAEASAILNTLPLVQAGLVKFQLLPLIPYSGFARLFAEEATNPA